MESFTLGRFEFNVQGQFNPAEQITSIDLSKNSDKNALFRTAVQENIGRRNSKKYFCNICIELGKPEKEVKSKHGNGNLMAHLLSRMHNPSQLTANSLSGLISQETLQFGQSSRFNFNTDEFMAQFRMKLVLDGA